MPPSTTTTPEELGAAVFLGAVFVSIPVAAGLTYLDSKRREKSNQHPEKDKEGEGKEKGKDGASDHGKGGK